MPKVTFNNKSSVFYSNLKSAVDQYFTTNSIKKTGNWKLYSKSLILIPAAIAIYVSVLVFPMPAFLALALCACLGFISASIGFNVMHDACHGSYSSRNWINNLMGLSLNMLGGNAFIWKFKHNIVHHTYTNIDGIDDDIAKSPLMRHCATQKWVPAHRLQHLYIVPMYALSSLFWVLFQDYVKYFTQKVYQTNMQTMSIQEHIIFWLSKVFYIAVYIVIPISVVGWLPWLAGFACMHITLGFWLALVFQLAHVVEDTSFVYVAEHDTQKIEAEWAIHQVNTTANFAPRNKIISWLVGGLNFQIEHHLFPRISHVHYPAINGIVKQACQQHNIAYNEFSTMGAAIQSHFKIMRQLGKRPGNTAI